MKEVSRWREFHHPPDEEKRKSCYDDWLQRKNNGEFTLNENFYQKALKSINEINKENQKKNFSNHGEISRLTSETGGVNDEISFDNEDLVHEEVKYDRYPDSRPGKVRKFNPFGDLNDLNNAIAEGTFRL
jgi:hypothetical protein